MNKQIKTTKIPQWHLELWDQLRKVLQAFIHWKRWKIKAGTVRPELLESTQNSENKSKWIVRCLVDVNNSCVITCTQQHNLVLNPLKSFPYFSEYNLKGFQLLPSRLCWWELCWVLLSSDFSRVLMSWFATLVLSTDLLLDPDKMISVGIRRFLSRKQHNI